MIKALLIVMLIINNPPYFDEPNIVTARVTAYAPLDNKSGICADSNPTITSRGLRPSREIVAVDPRKIPYGTQLSIPGYGDVVAGDTGGALRNYNGVAIDVFFDTHEEALDWGIRYIDVELK